MECGCCYGDCPDRFDTSALKRCHTGILSVLSALDFSPTIRFSLILFGRLTHFLSYQADSPQCEKLAKGLASDVSRPNSSTLLLIVDRRDDLVTPILRQVGASIYAQLTRHRSGHIKLWCTILWVRATTRWKCQRVKSKDNRASHHTVTNF